MITIVSDSSIAMTKAQAKELGIQIVPMNYTVDGVAFVESSVDTDGGYDKIKAGTYPCTTSQPSIDSFTAVFKELRKQNQEVLCITISSRLSGTFSSALIAAKEVDEEGTYIKVLDTRTAAAAMRLIATEALALIEKNKSLDEVFEALKLIRHKVGNAFSVENMEPLKRSGRLGFIRQSVSTILNIRPILQFDDGALECVGYIRGKRNQCEKLLELIPQDAKEVFIQHLDNEETSLDLCQMIIKKFPNIKKPTITAVGPVLAIHLGIPAIGLVWIH